MNVVFFFIVPSAFFLSTPLYAGLSAYARTNKPAAATTTVTSKPELPVRPAAPLNGTTLPVADGTGATALPVPATPAGGAGAPVAAAWLGAGVPATMPTDEGPLAMAT